jgi:hypothetical protein
VPPLLLAHLVRNAVPGKAVAGAVEVRYGSFTSVWVSAGNVRYSSDSDRIIDARQAAAAWRRFVASVGALPPNEARQLWHAVQAHAAGAIG